MRYPIVFVSLLLASGAAGFAQSAFDDPGIPDGEKVLYTATWDKDVYPMTQRTTRKFENGRLVYEVSVESAREDYRLKIDAAKMAVFYSWTRRKQPALVTETETRIVKNEIVDKPGEATMVDFSGLVALLRGFPFDKTRSLKIKTAGGSDFALTVTQTKEVDVKTKAGTFRCYELEFGMDGFFGAFVPKSYFWYEKAAPHRLIRYQGQTAGPGSPSYAIELAE
jgi:hypothetical protein